VLKEVVMKFLEFKGANFIVQVNEEGLARQGEAALRQALEGVISFQGGCFRNA
jgi:hypothetical protein